MVQVPIACMCSLRAKPIGIMHMIDQGEKDDVLICVCVDDPEFRGTQMLDNPTQG